MNMTGGAGEGALGLIWQGCGVTSDNILWTTALVKATLGYKISSFASKNVHN